jgi:hypothetical protein
LYPQPGFLEDLQTINQDDADLIREFIAEIDVDERAKNTLFKRNDEYYHPAFTVRAIDCFLQRGINVSRVRPCIGRLVIYRIIFALDNEYEDFYLLALVKKTREYLTGKSNDGYNYEPKHWITERILLDYEELGLPVLSS